MVILMISAKKAREISEENTTEKKMIREYLETAELNIRIACKKGKTNTEIFAGPVTNGKPKYPEVIQHLEEWGLQSERRVHRPAIQVRP